MVYALKMYPYDDKRKAFPIQNGSCSFGLPLTAESPWRIGQSWIVDYDSETLWRRMSKEFYYINGAYSPQTYAVIYGTLVKGYDGEGDSPDFWLTTPSIDLQWGEGCGEAMDEKKEDNTPAALLMTSDRDAHRHLIVKPARDKYRYGRNVTLEWTNEGCIRVWKSSGGGAESEIHSGVQLYLTGPLSLRIEPVAVSSSKIRFTATGAADDYNGDRVEDSVSAFTYDLTVSEIRFNYNRASFGNDAINLRKNRNEDWSIPHGEWTAEDGAVAPICYRTNQYVTIKAKFRTSSSLLHSVHMSVKQPEDESEDHFFNDFGAQAVSFSNGQTDDILFTMQGKSPRSISMFEQERLHWKASRINGDTKVDELSVTNTGPHKVYVIFNAPVAPWKNVEGNGNDAKQNAWTSALDFIVPQVEGASDAVDVLERTTRFLFSENETVRRYDSVSAQPHYYFLIDIFAGYGFRLSQYIANARTHVDCIDQAFGVANLSRLLGVANVNVIGAHPFGYINITYLTGHPYMACNNPLYENTQCFYPHPVCAADTPNRSSFEAYYFARYNNRVFDACIGPYLGDLQQDQYLTNVIDISTERNLQESIFVSTNYILRANAITIIGDECLLE